MFNQEAIEVLRNNFPKTCKMVDGRYKGGFDDTECEFGQALLLAIQALENEKEIPKIPDVWGDGYDDKGNMVYDMYACPNCGENYEIESDHYDYCPKCGQHMDRSGEVFE